MASGDGSAPRFLVTLRNLAVVGFDDVGGVNQTPGFGGVVEHRRQLLPMGFPGADGNSVLIAPLLGQLEQVRFGQFTSGRGQMAFRSVAKALRSFHTTYLRLLRIWWMMQHWISTWGKTERKAFLKPVRPSTQAMNTSSTPRFFKSVTTLNQKLAPSSPSLTQ